MDFENKNKHKHGILCAIDFTRFQCLVFISKTCIYKDTQHFIRFLTKSKRNIRTIFEDEISSCLHFEVLTTVSVCLIQIDNF